MRKLTLTAINSSCKIIFLMRTEELKEQFLYLKSSTKYGEKAMGKWFLMLSFLQKNALSQQIYELIQLFICMCKSCVIYIFKNFFFILSVIAAEYLLYLL